ncbi:efflux transporter outer membrane subunit [Novosphingobium sp.]|uniref:efflux transporter outer membrane subunit n=1 Tax=Novosphingobium sp. TaxID=1874826 RepID=UPI003B516D4E
MRRALILLATVALGGCDLAPHYIRPASPVPARLPAGGTYPQLTDAPTTAPADVVWHDFFTDARLRSLIDLALANNRDLRIAVANVAQARAQFASARANLFPTVSANAGATFERQSQEAIFPGEPRRINAYQVDAGISSWEIDLFGRLRNQSKEAFQTYLANEDARNAAQVLLISEVASAWLTLASDQDMLKVAKATTAADLQTFELTKTKFRVGSASELDVRQAQTGYDAARGQVASETALVAQDINALQLLTGAPPPVDTLPDGLPATGATLANLPVGLNSDVLLRRPDISEAEHRLRAANADIGAARAAFFPQISLTATLGTLSGSLSGLFGGGNGTWTVAPQGTVPIFDFGKNAANLRYSKASRDLAVAQYEKAIQTGFKEVADALAQRGTIQAQIEAQTSLEGAAAAALRLSDLRYRTGSDQFLTVLDAQRTLYSAQQSLISVRLTEQSNMVELYRSLGGGLK